jgi:hypothetical protein
MTMRSNVNAGTPFARAVHRSGAVLVVALGLQACGGGGDAAPSCAFLSGRWDVFQDGVATCSGSFGSGTVSFRAGSQMLIAQDACTISVDDGRQTSQIWNGTVGTRAIQIGGVPEISLLPDVVITHNTVALTGSIAADGRSANFSGSGDMAGTKNGVPGACSVASMTMQWNRLDR